METEKQSPVIVDAMNDVVTVYGIRYSLEMFSQLAFSPKEDGRWLKVMDRQDGVITVRVKDWETATKALLEAAKAMKSRLMHLRGSGPCDHWTKAIADAEALHGK